MIVWIERVEKVNDKQAAVQTTLFSLHRSRSYCMEAGKLCFTAKKGNLILPAEAASMPSSRWVLVLQLQATWDPNRVVHQGTRLGHRGGVSALPCRPISCGAFMFEEKTGLVHKIYLHIGNMRFYCAFKAFKVKRHQM